MNEAQIVGSCIAALIGGWVASDASRRGKKIGEVIFWGLSVFLALIIFLPAYLFFRWDENKKGRKGNAARQTTLCRYCGLYSEGDPAYCPHCSKQLKGAEEIHSSLR